MRRARWRSVQEHQGGCASVVTDHIDTFTAASAGSGRCTAAGLPTTATATGLNLQLFGGIALTVDGEPVDLSQKVAFKGMMPSDVPNFAFIVGYTNSSWTLKVGLLCEHFCRMLAHMDQHGYAVVRPRLPRPGLRFHPPAARLWRRLCAARLLSQLPRQGTSGPWVMAMDPNHDAQVLRHGPVADPCLVFDTASRPRHPVAAPKQVAVSA